MRVMTAPRPVPHLPVKSHDFFSLIRPGTTFQGTCVDEIASAVFWLRRPRKVLILGGGEGASVLPLSVFPDIEQVTLIDISKPRHYVRGVPGRSLDIEYFEAEALGYLADCSAKFDLVYCDMFTSQGYADIMLRQLLYEQISRILTPFGGILVNAFDIPSYLLPESGPTVTNALATALSASMGSVRILKHRRNALLLGLREPTARLFRHRTRALDGLDASRMAIASERAAEFQVVRGEGAKTSCSSSQIEALGWMRASAMLSECRRRLQRPCEESFRAFALHADLDDELVVAAIEASPFMRHIVLMELAANSFAAPRESLDRFGEIVSRTRAGTALDATGHSQAKVDLHTIQLNAARMPPH